LEKGLVVVIEDFGARVPSGLEPVVKRQLTEVDGKSFINFLDN